MSLSREQLIFLLRQIESSEWTHLPSTIAQLFNYLKQNAADNHRYLQYEEARSRLRFWPLGTDIPQGQLWGMPSDVEEAKSLAYRLYAECSDRGKAMGLWARLWTGLSTGDSAKRFRETFGEYLAQAIQDILAADESSERPAKEPRTPLAVSFESQIQEAENLIKRLWQHVNRSVPLSEAVRVTEVDAWFGATEGMLRKRFGDGAVELKRWSETNEEAVRLGKIFRQNHPGDDTVTFTNLIDQLNLDIGFLKTVCAKVGPAPAEAPTVGVILARCAAVAGVIGALLAFLTFVGNDPLHLRPRPDNQAGHVSPSKMPLPPSDLQKPSSTGTSNDSSPSTDSAGGIPGSAPR